MKTRKFTERYRGTSPKDAFTTGCRVSRDVHGMGRGNLCDKASFQVIASPEPPVFDDDIWTRQLPSWIIDPWGPAGCVELGGGNYLFFGTSPLDI